MDVLGSIKARYQRYIIRNFSKTKYAETIKQLHDSAKQPVCFIIGHGPSLTAADLDWLADNKLPAFGVNRINKIFNQTKWRPTYYVCVDPVMVENNEKNMIEIPAKSKLIPIDYKFYHGIDLPGFDYINANYDREKDGSESFSMDCTQQVNIRSTVTVACIQLAIHMGYREIYLLGIDHSFNHVILDKGRTVKDDSVKNYFVEDYDTDVQDKVVHDIGQTTKDYQDMQKFCLNHGIQVINASRKTQLEVFPRVSFDQFKEQYKREKSEVGKR